MLILAIKNLGYLLLQLFLQLRTFLACVKFKIMDKQTNSINWFEIPVNDLSRAKHFYQVAFSIHMEDMNMQGLDMAAFPVDTGNGKISGALVKSDNSEPSMNGVLIYMNADPDMTEVLKRIESVGGKVIMSKTLISPEIGYMANFIDSEGNRIALHSQE